MVYPPAIKVLFSGHSLQHDESEKVDAILDAALNPTLDAALNATLNATLTGVCADAYR